MQLKTTVLILTLICLLSVQGFAQQIEIEAEAKPRYFKKTVPDTSYVRPYSNKLMVAVIGTRKYQHIDISPNRHFENLTYRPNNPYGFGLGVAYNSLSLDLTIKFPYLTKSYRKKGDSDIYRIRLGYNKPRVWYSTMIQYCRGFYLSNIEKLDPGWFDNNQTYLLRPDITNISWYTAAYYSFNYKNITYQSAMGIEQQQKKSAGTFLLGGSVFLNFLSADSSMIPAVYSSYFSDDMALKKQFNIQYGLNFGYAHTIVIYKKIHFTLAVFPGMHYQTGHQITPLQGKKSIGGNFGSITEARAVIGYNGNKYYWGATLNKIMILHFPENTVLTKGYAHLKIYFGRRFNWKGWHSKKKRI